MDFLFKDGGKPRKTTKTKTKPKPKKTKGGNFLGSVGELVAPTGWESFVTTAGLFAIDRADAALRRGKESKKSVKKMSGGNDFLKQQFGKIKNGIRTTFGIGKNQQKISGTEGNVNSVKANSGKNSANGLHETAEQKKNREYIENRINEVKKEASFNLISLIDKGCPKTKKTLIEEIVKDYFDNFKGTHLVENHEWLYRKDPDYHINIVENYISRLDKLISQRKELLRIANLIGKDAIIGYLKKTISTNNGIKNFEKKLLGEEEIKKLEQYKYLLVQRNLTKQNSNSEQKYQENLRNHCLEKMGSVNSTNNTVNQNNKTIPGTEGSVNSPNNTIPGIEGSVNSPNNTIPGTEGSVNSTNVNHRNKTIPGTKGSVNSPNNTVNHRNKTIPGTKGSVNSPNNTIPGTEGSVNSTNVNHRNNKTIPGTEGSVNTNNSIFLKQFENGIKEINTKKYSLYMMDIDGHNTTKQRAINDLYDFYGLKKKNNTPNKLIEDYRRTLNEQISKREELLILANKIQKIDNSKISKFTNTNNGETIQDRLKREIKRLQSHESKFIERI